MTSSKLILVGDQSQNQNQARPRATSAYGTQNSRRNLNINPHGVQQNQVIVNMGAHQKAIIGSMKERKMQMRAIGGNKN